MTNFCKDCGDQDHESNLVYQKAGGWRCKFCNAHPKPENYFACRCRDWENADVKQLYKEDKCRCPDCGEEFEALFVVDGVPYEARQERCQCKFDSFDERSQAYHWGLGCCSKCENAPTKEIKDQLEEFAKKELVNHPSHYQSAKFEVINIIEEFNLNFNLGNVIKYILRAGKKENFKQDLEKARWYLSREIDKLP